jgi:hypothetical protein
MNASIEPAGRRFSMHEIWTRIIENMMDRVSGPMHLRVLLQPVMAVVFATISGLRDAREGKPPYLWSIFTDPGHRRDLLRDGWKSVGKVFLIAMLLDAIYQFIVQRLIYPGEVLLVAILLAIIPYIIMRGLVTRIATPFR